MFQRTMKLEETWKVATYSPDTKWLVTSPNGVWQLVADKPAWLPFTLAHAREVGAPLTACGQYAIEWRLFWHIPFDHSQVGVCSTCAEIVREDQ